MAKIAIVTDSTADIAPEKREFYHIEMVPLSIFYKDNQFTDQVDITNQAMYELLCKTDTLPQTSQPTPADFLTTYENLIDAGFETIFSLHLSHELSGTVNSARIAAKQLEDKADIIVVDSLSGTIGLGLLILSCAEMIQEGATKEEISAFIEKAVPRITIYFFLDSLDNLEKGGRIGKTSYMLGSILNIKPILMLKNGVISVHKKMRGNKSNRAIVELVRDTVAEADPTFPRMHLGYNNNRAICEDMAKLLKKERPDLSLEFQELGSVVSTHIGLGAAGVAFYSNKGE